MVLFIEDLITYIDTQGHGTIGTDLVLGSIPGNAQDDIIVLNDTGGIPNVDIANVDLITVQVLSRNKRQDIAREKLLSIQSTLHQASQVDLGTYTIISAIANDRPGLLGRDDKSRWSLVSNYQMLVRLS